MPPLDMSQVTLSAPVWFAEFFKLLGFILHMLLMHMWLVGLPVALVFRHSRSKYGNIWATRLIRAMPIIIALGINLGIVPLLFIQLLYPRAFYPATALMGWHWLLIIWLLIPAYYGIYIYVYGMSKSQMEHTIMPAWKRASGWLSALFFLIIGFFFVNGLVLMSSPESWKSLWLSSESAGATLGLGSAVGEVSLWPRWILMFGLALGTLGAWTLADLFWLGGNKVPGVSVSDVSVTRSNTDIKTRNPESIEDLSSEQLSGLAVRVSEETFSSPGDDYSSQEDGYRFWSVRLGFYLVIVGAVLFSLAGSWYVFGTWSEDEQAVMFGPDMRIFTILAALMPWIVVCVSMLSLRFEHRKMVMFWSILLVVTQILSLTVNGVARQALQIYQLYDYANITQTQVQTDWGAMALFLGAFLLGVCVLVWMLVQAVKASGRPFLESEVINS